MAAAAGRSRLRRQGFPIGRPMGGLANKHQATFRSQGLVFCTTSRIFGHVQTWDHIPGHVGDQVLLYGTTKAHKPSRPPARVYTQIKGCVPLVSTFHDGFLPCALRRPPQYLGTSGAQAALGLYRGNEPTKSVHAGLVTPARCRLQLRWGRRGRACKLGVLAASVAQRAGHHANRSPSVSPAQLRSPVPTW